MSAPLKPELDDGRSFDTSDLDVTPTEIKPPGKYTDRETAKADNDRHAMVVLGMRLASIEDRLGSMELRLGNIEGALSQILTALKAD
jgi:hypothetical protein